MKPYHKIQTIYLRDPATKYRTLLEGQYSIPEFKYLKDNEWVFTEKVDGTNIRVIYIHGHDENKGHAIWTPTEMIFHGKTNQAQIPPHLLTKLQEKFSGELFKKSYPNTSITLYGEGYGIKIQKGGGNYISNGVDFILFDVRINNIWLERANVIDIAMALKLQVVPVIDEGTLKEAVELVRTGFNSAWGDFPAEGLVLRPKTELLSRRGDRIITKIKYKDFPR